MGAPDSSRPATAKKPDGTVMGLRLTSGRLTVTGWAFVALVFVVPVLAGGVGLDMLLQWALGRCLGIWCWL